ncbi:MAG: hypothetical protein M3N53_02610 [Actinomycetota bacterium]|nr:hypothetical protein [Actinomycetota bacterium]
MLLLALLFVLVPLGISFLIPSLRVATVISLTSAAMAWLFIARFTYLQPIPLNEPEWWGGLAIISTLTAIGVIMGVFMRRRQTRSLRNSEP